MIHKGKVKNYLKKKRIKKIEFFIVYDNICCIGCTQPFILKEALKELSLKFPVGILKYLVVLQPGLCDENESVCLYKTEKKA